MSQHTKFYEEGLRQQYRNFRSSCGGHATRPVCAQHGEDCRWVRRRDTGTQFCAGKRQTKRREYLQANRALPPHQLDALLDDLNYHARQSARWRRDVRELGQQGKTREQWPARPRFELYKGASLRRGQPAASSFGKSSDQAVAVKPSVPPFEELLRDFVDEKAADGAGKWRWVPIQLVSNRLDELEELPVGTLVAGLSNAWPDEKLGEAWDQVNRDNKLDLPWPDEDWEDPTQWEDQRELLAEFIARLPVEFQKASEWIADGIDGSVQAAESA